MPSSRYPSSPVDRERDHRGAQRVEVVARVEQADERADRGRGVVVLGLAEQQRAAPLDVAQVDVVAEARADDAAVGCDDEHDLGLGVVPRRRREHADVDAGADRREHRRLGEDLGVGPDARPRGTGSTSRASRRNALRSAASAEPGRRVSREPPIVAWISARMAPAASWSPRARSSMTRSSIETGKVTPAAFTTCRSIGESSHGRSTSTAARAACSRRDRRAPPSTGPVAAATAAAGSADSVSARIVGNVRRDVDDARRADRHDARATGIRHPCAPDQGAVVAVVGQQVRGIRRPARRAHALILSHG